jgi:hypothetical protein
MIAKLVKAGYLRPEHRHDAHAITSAIANMKQVATITAQRRRDRGSRVEAFRRL